MYILCCLFSFSFLYDSWSRAKQHDFLCAEIYTYYPTFWLHCPWRSILFPPYIFFLFFFLLLPLPGSVLLFLAASPVHVVPWPTSCQPSQLASAPGNFSFRIKLHDISRLPSLLFLVFLPFSLLNVSLKLWLFEEYKRNILPKMTSSSSVLSMKSLIWYEISKWQFIWK